MQRPPSLSKRYQLLALAAVVLTASTVLGCREQTPPAPVASAAAPAAPRTREQAMNALMALPELKAWSQKIEATSGGKSHPSIIEYDPKPRLINGEPYYQLSFAENDSDAVTRWENFLVAQQGETILVDDAASEKVLTLEQWRQTRHPLDRVK